MRWKHASLVLVLLPLLSGCQPQTRPGEELSRRGDEMLVCGRLFHVGAPVVLYLDPGGYNAYRVNRRFPPDNAPAAGAAMEHADDEATSANRPTARSAASTPAADAPLPPSFGLRGEGLTPQQIAQVQSAGFTLPLLQKVVDQIVIHYDGCGLSRECFRVLHDKRNLSAHFLLDLDGTIYQTLDLQERAWHATIANHRSIGIEIANIGAFPPGEVAALQQWYQPDAAGDVRVVLPPSLGDGGIRTPSFVGHPVRGAPIRGVVQGQELVQYDLTPQQYDSLVKLVAALCRVFPRIPCDFPRDEHGRLIDQALSREQLTEFHGLLGHFHVQTNKVDPGPAFQWDNLVARARMLLQNDAR